jgi:hypothetical protein
MVVTTPLAGCWPARARRGGGSDLVLPVVLISGAGGTRPGWWCRRAPLVLGWDGMAV